MRLVKQLKSKIAKTSDAGEIQQLQHEIHIAEVDEAYTLYHPHAEPYISLYGKNKSEKDEDAPRAKAALEAERPPMWKTVEKTMEEGPGALKRLRERRSPGEFRPGVQSGRVQAERPKPTSKQSTKPDKSVPRKPMPPIGKDGRPQQLNRRERRRLMRLEAPVEKDNDEDDDGEFFA